MRDRNRDKITDSKKTRPSNLDPDVPKDFVVKDRLIKGGVF